MTSLIIFYQNVNGLLSNLPDVLLASLSFNAEVLCLTETNLNLNIHDSMVLGNKYVIYRCDRSILTSKKKSGGGCLIAVAFNLNSEKIDYVDKSIEFVSVKINLVKYSLFLCCVYIAPQLPIDIYIKYVTAFSFITKLMKKNDKIIIVGDFNIPNVIWQISDSYSYIPLDGCTKSQEFFKLIFDLGLNQFNYLHNISNNVLDLVFSDYSDMNISPSNSLKNPVDVFHPCFEIKVDMVLNDCSSKFKFIKDFNKTNFVMLNKMICDFDWSSFFAILDIDVACSYFYEKNLCLI